MKDNTKKISQWIWLEWKHKNISNKKAFAIKAELKADQDQSEKLQTYDSNLFTGQQWSTILVNISTTLLYFKKLSNTEKVVLWKSKGLPAKKLTTPTTTDNSLSPSIKWSGYSNFCLKEAA